MTRFILHGGETKVNNDSNTQFYQEMVNLNKTPINLLVISFARKTEDWISPSESEKIRKFNSDREIEIKNAEESKFLDQIGCADSIYIRGGDTKKLLKILSEYPNFSNAIKNKTIAGSSAGANVLARQYYSRTSGTVEAGNGLGILPYKIITHYDGSNQNENSSDLPTLAIKETEFLVIEQ